MLYFIHEAFAINLLGYITVRAGISFFLSLLLTLYLMPRFIAWARRTSSTQPINEYAPSRHQEKALTPTMGGVVFIVSALAASLMSMRYSNPYAWGALLVAASFASIGLIDDYAKVRKNKNLAGLKARTKLLLQLLFSTLIALYLLLFVGFDTKLYLPFIKNPVLDMGYGALLFWIVVIIAASNAVNLTDGLDGLASVPSIAAFGTFAIIIYITGNVNLSGYLLLPHYNVGEVVVVITAMMGAISGFLWYNCYPAEVFMGDSGSLSIGALLGYLAIISKSEILLLLIGLIFVIETLSVILQVGSFRLRKKRIFLMAPIHHHFEMKRWPESKIIVRFWMIAILANILALITLKIR